MDTIAKLSSEELEELFSNTADKKQMIPAVMEKDFWVCYMLDYLFQRSKWKDSFAFKGGTSLSKSYKVIERFSEDIDIILDWRILGYEYDEPWQARSNTQQDKFNSGANENAALFLANTFVPEVKREISKELNIEADICIDSNDNQTVMFLYPQIFRNHAILQEIRLEIGALAAWTPATARDISPYVAEIYPDLFVRKSVDIYTVSVIRTFWEKITILHREANRVNGYFPTRYSRHYYDLYCMYRLDIHTDAMMELELLEKVVEFNKKFYRCSWAQYEKAVIGSIKLIPNEKYFSQLQEDYEKMQGMMYGGVPEFGEVMGVVENLERALNGE